MKQKLNPFIILILICSGCASSMTELRKPTSNGSEGANGSSGSVGTAGQSGQVTLMGFEGKCVISPELTHFRTCLFEGRSVNERQHNGETIFQIAVKSGDLPMLRAVVDNPDRTNKPDLRVRFTRVLPNSPQLNIYELILLERVFINDGQLIQINNEKLKNSLYVDDNQVARLKIILSIESDKSALEDETREILNHLKASGYNDTPSVQEAIHSIETAISG